MFTLRSCAVNTSKYHGAPERESGAHSPWVDARRVSSKPRELSEGASQSHCAHHTLGGREESGKPLGY